MDVGAVPEDPSQAGLGRRSEWSVRSTWDNSWTQCRLEDAGWMRSSIVVDFIREPEHCWISARSDLPELADIAKADEVPVEAKCRKIRFGPKADLTAERGRL
ncbi:uncharacterized protein LOC116843048 [Odontomachus brunneus]|uniref:uncharacterized protein LOC116843048 n=1 Tax=Odontomachus brunneus TaxID=486640 RepID=UPI0013F22B88|nr:uncharacterized protein LOC116843048 [Odontomachus brunneus]